MYQLKRLCMFQILKFTHKYNWVTPWYRGRLRKLLVVQLFTETKCNCSIYNRPTFVPKSFVLPSPVHKLVIGWTHNVCFNPIFPIIYTTVHAQLPPWRWKERVTPKRRYLHEIRLAILITVRMQHLTHFTVWLMYKRLLQQHTVSGCTAHSDANNMACADASM
jgi:hypothetical protein